jgi:hypothetical protein
MAARTENGQKAFLVDLEKPNAREDYTCLTWSTATRLIRQILFMVRIANLALITCVTT